MPQKLAMRLMPPLFVLIWATGFVVARLVAPYSEPLSFLSLRFALAAAVIAAAALVVRADWPKTAQGWRDALVGGVLLHGLYLGAVFWSIKHGLPAGIAALVSGLQPLATGLLVGPLLGERVTAKRWAGFALGTLGALLVIAPRLGAADGVSPLPLAVCLAGMLSITLGTIWQKRKAGSVDLRSNASIQYLGAVLVTLPIGLFTEQGRFEWTPSLWFGLFWAVFPLSVGAISLLLFLIRHGAVAGVAGLLYLVPPVSALMAFVFFGETLSPVQIGGMAVAAVGVAIASRA
jgi:drug/metabolite transporter (DMT)-like permease